MLRIYHSNDLLVLKDLLVHQMQARPLPPLRAEQIMVQSQGMSHWLKLKIAEQAGVAANLEFPLPSNFVWQLYNRLFPELPERSHFDKSQMQWKLMRLLPAMLHQEACAPIAQYLEQDDEGIKCFQFAQTIADLFDQYLVYRPDWLLKWEEGVDDLEDTDVSLHPWQPIVWRALVAETESLNQSLKHRARLHTELKAQVARHPERLEGLPERIFVFGIAALPACYWQVLEAIAEKVEIHYFLLNPCRNYWGDLLDDRARARLLQRSPEVASYLDQGNSLLASWGKTGRDFLTQVHETDSCQDVQAWVELSNGIQSQSPSRNQTPAPVSPFSPDRPVAPDRSVNNSTEDRLDRLLVRIQRDIFELQDRRSAAFQIEALTSSDFKLPVMADDDSIRLISAHSPIREVQRLYDQLLYWFDRDPSLRPRDVLVMVPDIDQYAPFIEAVFSSAALTEADQHLHIPWAIADQSLVAENPLVESYLELLGLSDHRLGLSDVMAWLQVPAIRCRFGIEESSLPMIEGWLEKANIRWGLDAQHREQQGLIRFDQNSWSRGLRQLLLGAMTPDQAPGWQGDWPVSAVEGSDVQLLGQLIGFVQRLEYWRSRLSQRLAIQEIQTTLLALLDDFFDLDNLINIHEQADAQWVRQGRHSVQLIREALSGLQQDLELAGWSNSSTEKVADLSVAVIRRHLTEALSEQGGWQRFLAGPVNFCTLMPMRSIPFRAICLLGMNDSDYPRQVTPVSFDLMTVGKSRLGDRSRRDDDRYLFLEALCSAQEFFYVSYRGRSQQDNSEKQPSVLVSELLDYICDGFCLSQDRALPHSESRSMMEQWLVEELPLQPFNPNAFQSSQIGCSDIQTAATENPNRLTAVRSHSPLWASLANEFQRSNLGIADEARQPMAQHSEVFLDTRLRLQESFAVRDEKAVLHLSLDWDDVKKAMTKPCEFFFRRRLKANLSARANPEQEVEPFGLEGLNGYQVKESVLHAILTQNDDDTGLDAPRQQAFVKQQQALGKLPVGALGDDASSLLFDGYRPLAEQLARVDGERQASKSLMVSVDWQSESLGAVHADIEAERVDAFGRQLIRYRVGRLKGVHWFDAWMDLVLEALVEPSVEAASVTSCILLDQEGERWCLPRPTAETARAYVQACLDFYLSNWCQPEPLDLNALWSAMTRGNGEEGFSDKQLADARRSLEGSFSQVHHPAWQRCFPDFGSDCQDPEWLAAWLAGFQWIFEDCLASRIEQDDPSIVGSDTASFKSTSASGPSQSTRQTTKQETRQ